MPRDDGRVPLEPGTEGELEVEPLGVATYPGGDDNVGALDEVWFRPPLAAVLVSPEVPNDVTETELLIESEGDWKPMRGLLVKLAVPIDEETGDGGPVAISPEPPVEKAPPVPYEVIETELLIVSEGDWKPMRGLLVKLAVSVDEEASDGGPVARGPEPPVESAPPVPNVFTMTVEDIDAAETTAEV